MMKLLKIFSIELFLELCVFAPFSILYMVLFTSGSSFEFRDFYMVGVLWTAVIMYRVIYLQLPIAWILSTYFYLTKREVSGLLRAGINFTTFVVVVLIASAFSDVLNGFLEDELIHVTLIALIATASSPLLCSYVFLRNK